MKNWIPEICYEEDANGLSSHIPFIQVPNGKEMPKMLFVFESRETGEYEPGEDGSPLPIYDMDLHQYADMSSLKKKLSPETYDQVREALGLEPLSTAISKGKEISGKVRKNLE
tara:strand:+ start:1986 stop:2324 length:339 start_codon:yes stop_codon:yes gene_type:complete